MALAATTTTLTAMTTALVAAAVTSYPTEGLFGSAAPPPRPVVQISSLWGKQCLATAADAELLIGNSADGTPLHQEDR